MPDSLLDLGLTERFAYAMNHAYGAGGYAKAWQYIRDWNYREGNGHQESRRCTGDKMVARTSLKVIFNGPSEHLRISGRVIVQELNQWVPSIYLTAVSFPGMPRLDEMLAFSATAACTGWEHFVSRIMAGEIGIAIEELNQVTFKSAFGSLFEEGDEGGLLAWYSHIERVFYALEIRRVSRRTETALGFMYDPFIAGLPPDVRTAIARAATRLGLRPSELIEKIAREFLRQDFSS